jgi:hypothetical protein
VTVSVEGNPPVTDASDKISAVTTGGVTVSVVDAATPLRVPEIVAVAAAVTEVVVTVTEPVS